MEEPTDGARAGLTAMDSPDHKELTTRLHMPNAQEES